MTSATLKPARGTGGHRHAEGFGLVAFAAAVLALAASAGVLAGKQLARWFGVAVVGFSAIAMMFFIPAYPFWALGILR